jgi:hypothetical protein
LGLSVLDFTFSVKYDVVVQFNIMTTENEQNVRETTVNTAVIQDEEVAAPKWLVYTLTALAYGIPLAFLAYVLYINYLPFGYNKTFTIDVGAEGDTDASQPFYLEPSPDLSERKTAEDGTTYRELNGMANVVFKPNVVLKDAEITVSVEGEGVEIITPMIDFDPNSIEWDYNWDFTQGKTPEELGLIGNAYSFDGGMYFNGDTSIELPESADKFETESFAVYTEWLPTNPENNSQQIIGHYNWELFQDKEKVRLLIGRMDSASGPSYSIEYETGQGFFNNVHSALIIYSPSNEGSGRVSFFIDNKFVGIVNIGNEKLWNEYGDYNLSFGKSMHGGAFYYQGSLISARIAEGDSIKYSDVTDFKDNRLTSQYTAALITSEPTRIEDIKLYVSKN